MSKSVAFALVACLSLSSCSTLAPIAKDAILGGAQRGIEASANISKGDAEGADSVAQNANTAVSVDAGRREVYEGAIDTVVNKNGIPFHVLLLLVLLAGWAIPSPEEMGHGLIRLIRAIRGTNQQ